MSKTDKPKRKRKAPVYNRAEPPLQAGLEGPASSLNHYIIQGIKALKDAVFWLKKRNSVAVSKTSILAWMAVHPDFVEEWLSRYDDPIWTKHKRGCKLFVGSHDKSTGYVKVMFLGIPLLLHRIAYLIKGLGWPKNDASHLCHHSLCINPDHLFDEPSGFNQRRKNCRPWIMIKGGKRRKKHGIRKERRHYLVWLCKHQPLCHRYCKHYPNHTMEQLRALAKTEEDNGSDSDGGWYHKSPSARSASAIAKKR